MDASTDRWSGVDVACRPTGTGVEDVALDATAAEDTAVPAAMDSWRGEPSAVPSSSSTAVASDAIVVHEDELDAACHAASRCIDQLLWQGNAEVAKAVALLGPGIVVLPMFGKVSGVDDGHCLEYSSHPKRAARAGLMDRIELENKFGRMEPGKLIQDLAGGKQGLEAKLQRLSDVDLQDEVSALQDWKLKANGRMKTLEKRAAYAFVGIRPGSTDRAAIKRAFKRRALELHPDKGGDAERFQLLQEMKSLLMEATPKELEQKAEEGKERDPEQEEAQESRKDKDAETCRDDEDEEFVDTDFSDDSYDVDEELKKMFPKDKKKKKRRKPEHDDDFEILGKNTEFNRDKHLAARLKLHRNVVEMWERAGKLVDEIKNTQHEASGESLRTLRKFVDRFANVEVTKLKDNDPKKAERIFRRFLEQGSEVICAAGAVDPVATVSTVAMQINYPLLQRAPSSILQDRCSALVEAIQNLPVMFRRHVGPVEDLLSNRQRAAQEATAAAQAGPLHIFLLMPDPSATVEEGEHELPGVCEAEIDMPPGSAVGDLRAAGLQVFGRAVARLFCGGCFLGDDRMPLSRIAELVAGAPVHCLPSNKLLSSRVSPAVQCPRATEQAASINPHALPEGAVEAAAKAAAARREMRKVVEPSAVFDGLAADPCEATPKPCGKENEAEAVNEHTNRDAEDDDDSFFDDFFDSTKKAADEKAAKEKEDAAKREEEAERRNRQDRGLSAMERRLQAQKQAAEAKKKLDAEKKKASAARKKTTEQHMGDIEAAKQKLASLDPAQQKVGEQFPGRKVDLLAAVRKKAEQLQCCDLVLAKDNLPEQALSRLRTAWDENWHQSCAGGRRADGSAIFCYPCNAWIAVGEPFDHQAFELHCEKVGHYGWID